MDSNTARTTLAALIDAVTASLLERADEVRLATITAIAGHHVVMLGKPGVAKSKMARALSSGLSGARYFEKLMARGTETSELFGSKDIEAMKQGRARRVLDGTVVDAEVVFLDEAFKAHSAILNELLGVLNERRYTNGADGVVAVPLRFAIVASNEVPDEDDTSLTAFYDRFLTRMHVVELQDDASFARLMRGDFGPTPVGLSSLEALDFAREESRKIDLSDGAIAALRAVVVACRQRGVDVSDRRAVAIGDFLRATAWLDGRSVVDAGDVGAIAPCLWSRLDQIATVEEIVRQHAPSWQNDARDIRRVLVEQRDAIRHAGRHKTLEAAVAALQPIARVLKDLDGDIAAKVKPLAVDAARDLAREVQAVRDELTRATAEAYAR